MIVVDLPPAQQKYLYGRLDMIIGMMLHVGVMSFGALTPEISVAYDIRNYGFAEFIGHPELVVGLESLASGKLLEKAKFVWNDRVAYTSSFAAKRDAIEAKQTDFLQQLKR